MTHIDVDSFSPEHKLAVLLLDEGPLDAGDAVNVGLCDGVAHEALEVVLDTDVADVQRQLKHDRVTENTAFETS